jgi:glycerol uptake facilitator-like aquaporin
VATTSANHCEGPLRSVLPIISGGRLNIRLGSLRYARQSVPWLVGLVIVAAYWFTSSTSFANPAVTLARGFTTTLAGIAINHVPAFVIAQIIGALGAAAISGVLFSSAIGERREAGDATQAIAPGE